MIAFRGGTISDFDVGSSSSQSCEVKNQVVERPIADNPDSNDWRSTERLVGANDRRDVVLDHLRNLTLISLNGYQEIAALAEGVYLKSFSEVMIRQRSAEQRALCDEIQHIRNGDETEHAASLAILRSLWRLAILNLARKNHAAFLECAERAESFLEEGYLAAAEFILDSALAQDIRDYALMVYGARSICEELADNLSSGSKLSAEPRLCE